MFHIPKDKSIYNYRYFLPYAPEWGTYEFCDKRLEELLSFCREADIKAVQFYVNILPGTYYMPAHSASEQKHWAQWMCESVKPAIEKIGVSYQLNFQCLLGHSTRGWDMRKDYGWEYLVNQHGQQDPGCACPLGTKFREKMGEMLKLWASTKPDVIWIDDDFRLHNHSLWSSCGEMDFYCFCDLHLKAFSEYIGRYLNREEIVDALTKPGKPESIRLKWMDFLGKTMVNTADWIREVVNSVSKEIRLALMHSAPDTHSIEGRKWKDMLNALSGDHRPMTRPPASIYSGTIVPLKENIAIYRYFSQSITTMDSIFGQNNVDYGPELENTRFTTWCKSVANTRYVLTLGQLLGCPQITLSMNDLDGSAINEEPSTIKVLKKTKPLLDTLAGLQMASWKPGGIVLPSDPEQPRKIELNSKGRISDLGLTRYWDVFLMQMAIPTQYVSVNKTESGDIVALDGVTAWLPSDNQIQDLLRGQLLLDSSAAKVLQQRGFGNHIGVKIGELNTLEIQSEEYLGGVLPEITSIRVPHRGTNWHSIKLCGGQIISRLIDPFNKRHIGSVIFENSLGGRVAVCSQCSDFGSHARLRWLHGIILWLTRRKFPILPIVPHHCLSVVRSNQDKFIFALANLGSDPIDDLQLRTGFDLDDVSKLSHFC